MAVMTVTGPVDAVDLGATLPHEHLLVDLRNQFTPFDDPEKDRISREPVRMEHLGRLRRNPYALRDNLLLDDVDLAVAELRRFADLGGGTVVDCTSVGIGRRPEDLRRIADATGLHVVAGCGLYTEDTHPADMDDRPVEALAEAMVRDMTDGVDGTDVRAGVMGEIGTSDPLGPGEEKALRAAALAFRSVPAAVYVHTYPWATHGLAAGDILMEGGVPPEKIVVCHADVEPEPAYIRAILDAGMMLEFDNFGKEFWIDPDERGFAGGVFMRDAERVELVVELVDLGYAEQLLVTNDICLKSMLHAFGGWGYDHILRHVVPMLRHAGVGEDVLDLLLRKNPARLLDLAG